MKKRNAFACLLAVTVAVAAFSAGPVGHASGVPASPANTPAGYQVVYGGPYSVGARAWVLEKVTCPGTKQPIMGGVEDTHVPDLFNLGSSYPDASTRAWLVIANDLSGTPTTFYEYVVCLNTNSSYKVESSNSTLPGESTSTGYYYCPTGMAVGGGIQSGIDLGVGLNSSLPYDRSHWQLEETDADSSSDSITGYTVCHPKPTGYSLQGSPTSGLKPGGSVTLTAACPAGSVPVSGGGYTTLPESAAGAYMSSSYPTSSGWVSTFYDGSNSNIAAEASALCAS